MKILYLILVVAFSSGCVVIPTQPNLFQEYYQDVTPQWSSSAKARVLPPSGGAPRIETFALENFQNVELGLVERGFALLGHADFVGALQTRQRLIEQAERVGAEFVLYNSQFSHTEQGVIPWMSYQPGQTSTTRTYGTLNSGGGFSTYSGTATTTTPGTFQTETIPISVSTFAQRAYFYRRLKPGIFGGSYTALSNDRHARLQRNTGVIVATVVEIGPAFNANVLRGDVIVQLNDKSISTVTDLDDLLMSYAGQKVTLTIIRDTKTMTLDIQLNELPARQ